jgi:hypothetical protein
VIDRDFVIALDTAERSVHNRQSHKMTM